MEFLSPIVHSALLRVETYLRSSPFASFLPRAPEVPEIFIPTRTIPLPELVTPCPTTPIVQVAHVTGFPLFLTAALTFVLLASAFGLGLFVVLSRVSAVKSVCYADHHPAFELAARVAALRSHKIDTLETKLDDADDALVKAKTHFVVHQASWMQLIENYKKSHASRLYRMENEYLRKEREWDAELQSMRDELRNERARFKEDRALWKTATEKLVNAKQSTIDKKDEELKAAQEHIRLCKLNSQDLNGICKEQNEVIGRLGASVRNLTKASADAKKENAELSSALADARQQLDTRTSRTFTSVCIATEPHEINSETSVATNLGDVTTAHGLITPNMDDTTCASFNTSPVSPCAPPPSPTLPAKSLSPPTSAFTFAFAPASSAPPQPVKPATVVPVVVPTKASFDFSVASIPSTPAPKVNATAGISTGADSSPTPSTTRTKFKRSQFASASGSSSKNHSASRTKGRTNAKKPDTHSQQSP